MDSLFGFNDKQDAINRKGNTELLKALGLTESEFKKKQDAIRERNVQAETKRLSALKVGTKGLEKFAKSLDKAPKSIASQIERRAELQLPRALAESGSQLQRERLGIARLGLFGGSLGLSEITDVNKSLTNERDKLSQILSTFDDTPTGRLAANKTRTQIAGIDRELKANSIALQSSPLTLAREETNLRRQQFELARLSPLGTISALPELDAISDAIRDELKVLESIAQSSKLGPLETIKLQQITTQGRLELRRNERVLLDIFKDSVVSQALGAGRFSSILFTDKQNVGIGLRQGVFGLPKEIKRAFLGNIDPSIVARQSVKPEELLAFNPFANINKARPRGVTSRPRLGNNSADSIENAGKFLVKISEQMKQESQGIDNRFAEPISSPGSGRIGVQPLSP